MSYRIKVPAKTLPVDEAHLLSGLEHQLHRLQAYRRPLLVGLAVLVLAAGIVGGVFWMDRQAAKKAEAAGLRVVMNRCMMKTHQRLLGERFHI